MRLSILFLFLFVVSSGAQVLQNIARNPSFELYSGDLPDDLSQISKSSYWNSPTKVQADYYHEKSVNRAVSIPVNKMGRAQASSGKAYAGIYGYTSRYHKKNYRSYIQIRLKQPLAQGELYCVKIKVYLSESSNRALFRLGVGGAKSEYKKDVESHIIDVPFVHLRPETDQVLNQRKWIEIKGLYTAVGGETYMIFGNFDADQNLEVDGALEIDSFRNPLVDYAYYYIDDVCITGVSSNYNCDCGSFDVDPTINRERIKVDMTLFPRSYEIDEHDILEQVKFVKGKAVFLPGFEKELDELYVLLRNNAGYIIEISGHTSDEGDPKENHFLSKDRAKAVYDYLINKGIHPDRLYYRGYGQSRPRMTNETQEGRIKNERIQIKVLGK